VGIAGEPNKAADIEALYDGLGIWDLLEDLVGIAYNSMLVCLIGGLCSRASIGRKRRRYNSFLLFF